jgi:3-oxoacyl-[acyl-carrier protein] reductase
LGANLLLVARASADFKTIASELAATRQGSQILDTCEIDITTADAAAQLFRGAWSSPDVLINNAGIQGPIGPLSEMDPAQWHQALQVNLTAPVMLMRAVVPAMQQKNSGVIINLSGGGAAGSRPGFSAYAAAKTGLVRVSECLADEVVGFGIAITAIAPGAMPTAMLEGILAAGPEQAGSKEFSSAQKIIDAGAPAMARALDLCAYLSEKPRIHLSGKLIAAQWDAWDQLDGYASELRGDVYTLRRIVPKDRGMTWGKDT